MWDLIKITISLKDPRVTYQSRQTLRPTPNSVRWDEVNQVKYRFQALHFQGDGKFTSGLTKAAAHRCSSNLTTVKKFGYFKSKHPSAGVFSVLMKNFVSGAFHWILQTISEHPFFRASFQSNFFTTIGVGYIFSSFSEEVEWRRFFQYGVTQRFHSVNNIRFDLLAIIVPSEVVRRCSSK